MHVCYSSDLVTSESENLKVTSILEYFIAQFLLNILAYGRQTCQTEVDFDIDGPYKSVGQRSRS